MPLASTTDEIAKIQYRKDKVVVMSEWSDVFYIMDLNDGSHIHRSASEDGFYQLCLKPIPEIGISRHFCLNSGTNIKNFMKSIAKYVSRYGTVENFCNEGLQNSRGQLKLGTISLQQADEYWEEYKNTKHVKYFQKEIKKAINVGSNKLIIKGNSLTYNVGIMYNYKTDKLIVDGKMADFFNELFEILTSFDGKTKKELYHDVKHLVDVECLNEIFSMLKENGVHGIKQMKTMEKDLWLKILVPLVNEWSFYSEDDESIYCVEEDE